MAKETCSQYATPALNWFSDEIKAKLEDTLTDLEQQELNEQLKKLRNRMLEDVLRNIVFGLDNFGEDYISSFALIEMNHEGEVTDKERLIQHLHGSYEDMLCSRIEQLN